jgi:hypothetical protein
MVLSLKTWKSRSLPVLPRTFASPHHDDLCNGCAVVDENGRLRAAVLLGTRQGWHPMQQICGAALRKADGPPRRRIRGGFFILTLSRGSRFTVPCSLLAPQLRKLAMQLGGAAEHAPWLVQKIQGVHWLNSLLNPGGHKRIRRRGCPPTAALFAVDPDAGRQGGIPRVRTRQWTTFHGPAW